MRVCDTSLTTGSLLLSHAITTMPHTCLCNDTPLTRLTEPTNRSRTRDHGCLDPETRQQMYEHHKRIACDIVASAPCSCITRGAARMRNQNTIQATGSVTKDSLLLQHTCVWAVIEPGLGFLLMPQTSARVHAHARMCVCGRRNDLQRSTTAPRSEAHFSARICKTHLCEVTHTLSLSLGKSQHVKTQATGSVTTGSLCF